MLSCFHCWKIRCSLLAFDFSAGSQLIFGCSVPYFHQSEQDSSSKPKSLSTMIGKRIHRKVSLIGLKILAQFLRKFSEIRGRTKRTWLNWFSNRKPLNVSRIRLIENHLDNGPRDLYQQPIFRKTEQVCLKQLFSLSIFSFYWPQIFAKGPVSESQPKTFDKRSYGKSEKSKSSNIATFLPKSITSYHQEKISHNRHAEKILKT